MYSHIQVAVVESPRRAFRRGVESDGFRDLVPWADPYIVGLVSKLERSRAYGQQLLSELRYEAEPPLWADWSAGEDLDWRTGGDLNGD